MPHSLTVREFKPWPRRYLWFGKWPDHGAVVDICVLGMGGLNDFRSAAEDTVMQLHSAHTVTGMRFGDF